MDAASLGGFASTPQLSGRFRALCQLQEAIFRPNPEIEILAAPEFGGILTTPQRCFEGVVLSVF